MLTPKAISDIQKAIDYYDEQQPGLGLKFDKSLDNHFAILKKNPHYQVRYNNVHCLPLRKYPYMIHFLIENKTVRIVAVFHTSLNPDDNWGRRK